LVLNLIKIASKKKKNVRFFFATFFVNLPTFKEKSPYLYR